MAPAFPRVRPPASPAARRRTRRRRLCQCQRTRGRHQRSEYSPREWPATAPDGHVPPAGTSRHGRRQRRPRASRAGCWSSTPALPWGPGWISRRRYLRCKASEASCSTWATSPGHRPRHPACRPTGIPGRERQMRKRFHRQLSSARQSDSAGGSGADRVDTSRTPQKSSKTAPQVNPPPTPSSIRVSALAGSWPLPNTRGQVPAGSTPPRCCRAGQP